MNLSHRVLAAGCVLSIFVQAGCTSSPTKQSEVTNPIAKANATASANGGTTSQTNSPLAQQNRQSFQSASIYFEYDSTVLTEQSYAKLRAAVAALSGTRIAVEIQGNADERGSREYNMALGQKRAVAVKSALSALGVNASQIETISFGEDKPKAKGHDEAAWAENRRADLIKK